MEEIIKLMVVEDDLDFIYLLKKTLEAQTDMALLGACQNADSAVRMAMDLRPDMVLMDLNLSEAKLDGVDAARSIRVATKAKILILTSFDDPETVLTASVRSFASGYIFKHQPSLLVQNIRELAQGHTAQEYLIMSAILSALSPAEKMVFQMMMGENIDLLSSPKTIANQKTGILKKLGLRSQKEMVHIFETYKK